MEKPPDPKVARATGLPDRYDLAPLNRANTVNSSK